MMRIRQDGRYALRVLVKSPGFTLVAVMTLALGIGANTALFSVANLWLQEPLRGVPHPEELVQVWGQLESKKGTVGDGMGFAPFRDYFEYREAKEVFDLAVARQYPVKLTWKGASSLLGAQVVSGNYFGVMGVSPLLGRSFRADETETTNGPPVAVVSYNAWQRRLGGTKDILGQGVKLNGDLFTIVGVLPKDFRAPAFSVPLAAYDHLFPADAGALVERGRAYASFTGRLRPGVTVAQAQSRVTAIAARLAEQFAGNKGTTARVVRMQGDDSEQGRAFVFVVGAYLALGLLVLLVACANVCNLLLARAQARHREMAIRSALGASRGHLVHQLLVESSMLALLGGLLGLLVAHWTQVAISAWWWPELAQSGAEPRLRLDPAALAYTAVLLVFSTLFFGLVPALRLSGLDLVSALKGEEGRDSRGRLSAGLVIAQVATAFVLLVISGLLLRSMRAAQNADLGFDPRHVLTAGMDLSFESYPKESWPQLYQDIQQRLAALPGVESASLAQGLPIANWNFTLYAVEGISTGDGARQQAWFTNADTEYLHTLHIPLVQGRNIRRTDDRDHPRVALVNRSFAEQYWPNQNPLGHVLTLDASGGKPVEIVGVFADTKFGPFTQSSSRIVFLSLYQSDQPQLTLLVRTTGEPQALSSAVRDVIKKMNPDMLLLGLASYEDTLNRNSDAFFAFRVGAVFASALASLALVLAIIGLYGLLAFRVSQRTREVGVRMALGADAADVRWLFIRRGLLLTAVGVAVGFVAALAIKRLISGYLYGISPLDPATLVVVPVVLGAVAFVASYAPARRATRIDPMVALRSE